MMYSATTNETRAALYRLLSRLYRAEVDAPLLAALKGMTFPTDAPQPELAEGYARLHSWLDTCGSSALDDLAADYATVFLAAGSADGSAAIPCESVYTSPRKIYMQEAWETVTAIYRTHELGKAEVVDDLMEDHLALELTFLVHLMEENDLQAQQDFLEHHLLNWVPDFAADIDRYARQDFYKAVGLITLGLLKLDQALLSGLNDPENQALREAPSFSVRADRMENIFARLKERYRILAPRRLSGADGPVGYGEIDAITDVVCQEKCPFSPGADLGVPSPSGKDVLLFLRPCDLNAVRDAGPETKLVLLECSRSFDGCDCVALGTNRWEHYAAAVRIDDICALVEIKDETLLPYFQDEVPIRFTPRFVTHNGYPNGGR